MFSKASGQFEDAISHFTLAVKQNENKCAALLQLGLCYRDLGNVVHANKCFDQVIKHCRAEAKSKPNDPNLQYVKGYAYMSRTNYKPSLIQVLKKKTNSTLLAIRYFDRAIELDPSHAASHLNKGFAMTALKKHSEAEECFKRASELAHAKSSIKI